MVKKNKIKTGWGICVYYPNGTVGWLMDEDLDVKIYPTKEDGAKAMKAMKKNPRYSWNLPMEVKEFTGLSSKKH